MKKIYDKIIAPFSGNQLALFDVLLRNIKVEGLTIEQYLKEREKDISQKEQEGKLAQEKFTQEQKEYLKQIKSLKAPHGICPECETPLRKVPVNRSRGDQVGGSFNWMFECMNDDSCIYHILIKG